MDWNLATIWEAVADAVPARPALVNGDQRRSWTEFDDRAARLATGLAELGVGHDSKVASYLHNGNEYLEALFATFKLRAVPVNVNYRYLEDELAYLLDNSDAEVLLFDGSLGGHVAAVRDRIPKLRAVVQVDDGSEHLDGAIAYEDLIGGHEPAPRISRSGDDLYFLYTGGTTGMPKGVMWRSEDLWGALGESLFTTLGEPIPESPTAAGETARRFTERGRATVHLPASPLMHGTGAMTTFQALFVGGTIVTLEGRSFDPHELWRVVQRERVTQMAIVGDAFAKPMVRALDEAEADGEPYDLTSMFLIISSGVMWSAPVKEALIARQPMVCLDSLGSSEGTGFANSTTTPGGAVETARFTIGPHATVLTDDGRAVEPGSGEVGQLAVGGNIPIGYYKDPAKTATTFREIGGQRWSIPGDFARVEADGTVVLLGRGSACINSGGEKVYPEEVEEAVKTHPGVVDCLVVGVPDERFGEAVTAVVQLATGAEVTDADLHAHGAEHLARFKRPRTVVIVDRVPRASNGKADYAWARAVATDHIGTTTP